MLTGSMEVQQQQQQKTQTPSPIFSSDGFSSVSLDANIIVEEDEMSSSSVENDAPRYNKARSSLEGSLWTVSEHATDTECSAAAVDDVAIEVKSFAKAPFVSNAMRRGSW